MSPHLVIDDEDNPREEEVDYADLSPDAVTTLAMQGDQGAVDYLNGDSDVEKAVRQPLPPATRETPAETTARQVENDTYLAAMGSDATQEELLEQAKHATDDSVAAGLVRAANDKHDAASSYGDADPDAANP